MNEYHQNFLVIQSTLTERTNDQRAIKRREYAEVALAHVERYCCEALAKIRPRLTRSVVPRSEVAQRMPMQKMHSTGYSYCICGSAC